MPNYMVQWEIELSAENPRDAAKEAWEIMRDPGSIATVFDVFGEDGSVKRIDLEEEDENEMPEMRM